MKSIIYGIDVHPLERACYTGTEWYLFHLLREMMRLPLQEGERVVLYVSKPIDRLGVLPSGWEWRVLPWPRVPGWTKVRLAAELWYRTPNVFFQPAHEVPMCSGRTTVVTTVHDLAFLRIPELYPVKDLARQKRSLNRVLKRAEIILAVSNTTAADLAELRLIDVRRVTVVPLGIDPAPFTSPKTEPVDRFQLTPGTYFFSLSRLEKKKNIVPLIRAYKIYRERGGTHALVLGGSMGFGGDAIQRALDGSEGVHLLGYVPETDVPALMAHAAAYLFPSVYEGFGLPVLEAMAASVPVLVNDTPALREVGGRATLIADVNDAKAFADAMRLVCEPTTREKLVPLGKERVATYTWEQTAERTLVALRKAAGV